MSKDTLEYFEDLSEAAPAALIPAWSEQVENAENNRSRKHEVMDIYRVAIPKAATRKEIELQLSQEELSSELTGQASWISEGLKCEEAQCVFVIDISRICDIFLVRFELRSYVRTLRRAPTTAQKLDLVKRRQQVKKIVQSFMQGATKYLGVNVVNKILEEHPRPIIDIEEPTAQSPDEPFDMEHENNRSISRADPERQFLPFPSAISEAILRTIPGDRRGPLLELQSSEVFLRTGHAEDALEIIRGALLHTSWQFINRVRGSEGAERTRAYDKINMLAKIWRLQRRVYNYNRDIILQLNTSPEMATKYPVLAVSDCVTSNAVADPNARGQSTDRLPWFWTSNRGGNMAAEGSEHYNECKAHNLNALNDL